MSTIQDPPTNDPLLWSTYAPRMAALQSQELTADNVNDWLKAWSDFDEELDELGSKLYVNKSCNTADEVADRDYKRYYEEIFPPLAQGLQSLKQKLLDSKLEPANFKIPLRNMRSEAALFREENLPLQQDEITLSTEYGDVVGAQTAVWNGEEVTLTKLGQQLQDADRSVREKAWRLMIDRSLQDRATLNDLWTKLLAVRLPQATNAGFSNFIDFRWQQMQRFDYTPANCQEFRNAIREHVVPLATEIYANRQKHLGLETLRPWDLDVDDSGAAPLRPFETGAELDAKCGRIFDRLDSELGAHYKVMQKRNLLDLENRKNKAPGGYCTHFSTERVPFIFMNAVGTHRDVQTMLHEGGHAFHVFESAGQRYSHDLNVNTEFAEVASMGMELLSQPYLDEFYSPEDANRARVEHLQKLVLFWPYMAVVDGFQHWAYSNPGVSGDAAACDRAWAELWDQFMVGIDYTGLEDAKATGWHRKLHIFEIPFYYVEYGLAQLGAVQLWRNSLSDEAGAIRQYRHALSLGGTVSLPEMFSACGCKFGFDTITVSSAVNAIRTKLTEYGAL